MVSPTASALHDTPGPNVVPLFMMTGTPRTVITRSGHAPLTALTTSEPSTICPAAAVIHPEFTAHAAADSRVATTGVEAVVSAAAPSGDGPAGERSAPSAH